MRLEISFAQSTSNGELCKLKIFVANIKSSFESFDQSVFCLKLFIFFATGLAVSTFKFFVAYSWYMVSSFSDVQTRKRPDRFEAIRAFIIRLRVNKL